MDGRGDYGLERGDGKWSFIIISELPVWGYGRIDVLPGVCEIGMLLSVGSSMEACSWLSGSEPSRLLGFGAEPTCWVTDENDSGKDSIGPSFRKPMGIHTSCSVSLPLRCSVCCKSHSMTPGPYCLSLSVKMGGAQFRVVESC